MTLIITILNFNLNLTEAYNFATHKNDKRIREIFCSNRVNLYLKDTLLLILDFMEGFTLTQMTPD